MAVWCKGEPEGAFYRRERHGGHGMVRGVRWWRGHAACGTGTCREATYGPRERMQRVGGVVAHVVVVGDGLGGRVLVGVVVAWACLPGARPVVGWHGSGKCGQCEGSGVMGLTWGASGGHWLPPRHAGSGFWCWFVKCPWWWPCSWHGCLGLGFRVWGS